MRWAVAPTLCLSVCAMARGDMTYSTKTEAIDYSISYMGTYDPTGMTSSVDVYTLAIHVEPDWVYWHKWYPQSDVIGAFMLDVGADYLGYGGNPFQVGRQWQEYQGTPTALDA